VETGGGVTVYLSSISWVVVAPSLRWFIRGPPRIIEWLPLTLGVIEQPLVTLRIIELLPLTLGVIEQPLVTLRIIEQPLVTLTVHETIMEYENG
jgi:hypothetical protein